MTEISAWATAQLVREASIWSGLDHPHIVKLVGHLRGPERHVLLLEHAAGGELFDRIIAMQVGLLHAWYPGNVPPSPSFAYTANSSQTTAALPA